MRYPEILNVECVILQDKLRLVQQTADAQHLTLRASERTLLTLPERTVLWPALHDDGTPRLERFVWYKSNDRELVELRYLSTTVLPFLHTRSPKQQVLLLRAVRDLIKWADARLEGFKRHEMELARQQAKWIEALEAELAVGTLAEKKEG